MDSFEFKINDMLAAEALRQPARKIRRKSKQTLPKLTESRAFLAISQSSSFFPNVQ